MANIKQQKKRIKTNEKARLVNAAYKSSLKTALKNVEVAVEANNVASKKLDKAISKGLVHKNYVARQKSRLSKLVNTLK